MTGHSEQDTGSKFSGIAAFRSAVREFLHLAAAQGWKKLILSDPDFADWPLGELATVHTLGEWAAPGRSLTLLAGDFDPIVRRHARFVQWRKRWSHIIECRQSPAAEARATPSAIWADGAVLHRFDVEFCAGLTSIDPLRRTRLRQDLDEWIATATPAFPASKLGL